MRKTTLLDIPYNLFRLEIFDIVLVVALPSPAFFFGAIIFQPFMLAYPFMVIALFVWVRNKKKDKRYGYMQRYMVRSAEKLRSMMGRDSRIRYA